MAYLVGTDEAGYGPNLGPLVVAASVWEVPDAWIADLPSRNLAELDLREKLRPLIAGPDDKPDPKSWVLGDSKSLYSPRNGVRLLEQGVLTAIGLATPQTFGDSESETSVEELLPNRWRKIWPVLGAASPREIDQQPWFVGYDAPLPQKASRQEIALAIHALRRQLPLRGVSLQRLRAVATFPDTFNQLLDRYDNKATTLSQITLSLVHEIVSTLDDRPVFISCDKHGGRDHYHACLQTLFPDDWIEIVLESRARSTYRFGRAPKRVEIHFVAKGESFLPSALASMTAKYLRELAMTAFNQFWCERVADLKPTAGYPVDAARFRDQIRDIQQQLGISDHQLWRNR